MAYTYDAFLKAAQNAGMYDSFSQEDLVITQKHPEYGLSMLKLQQDAGKATTPEQKLLVQEAVNQLRSSYGAAGSAATPTTQTSAVSPLTREPYAYGRENSYQQLLDDATTQSSFDYDHRTDPTYQTTKTAWQDDGDRTSAGVLSTPGVTTQPGWAAAAVQQSNNYHDAKLNDQIPTIRQNAYAEYLQEEAMKQQKLDALTQDKAFDYGVHTQQQQLDQEKAQQLFDNAMQLNSEFGTQAPGLPDLSGLADGSKQLLNTAGVTDFLVQQAKGQGQTVDPNVINQYLAMLTGHQSTVPTVDSQKTGAYVAQLAGEHGYTVDPNQVAAWVESLQKVNDRGFGYSKDTAYQEALDQVIGQEDFAYDPAADPLQGSLRKTMLREGDREMRDTLAELNAATGGVANSYSVRAAADAGNAFTESLHAGGQDLRRTAYQEYLDGFAGKLQGLSQLEEDRATEYQKWLTDYQLQEAAKQQEFNNALALYQQIGLTPEIAAILGVPYEEPASSSGSGGTPKPNLSGYTVTNKQGDGWIEIGGSRISKDHDGDDALNEKIKSGEIIATSDPKKKTITYTYAKK